MINIGCNFFFLPTVNFPQFSHLNNIVEAVLFAGVTLETDSMEGNCSTLLPLEHLYIFCKTVNALDVLGCNLVFMCSVEIELADLDLYKTLSYKYRVLAHPRFLCNLYI